MMLRRMLQLQILLLAPAIGALLMSPTARAESLKKPANRSHIWQDRQGNLNLQSAHSAEIIMNGQDVLAENLALRERIERLEALFESLRLNVTQSQNAPSVSTTTCPRGLVSVKPDGSVTCYDQKALGLAGTNFISSNGKGGCSQWSASGPTTGCLDEPFYNGVSAGLEADRS